MSKRDNQFVARVLAGDATAFGGLYDAHAGGVKAFFLRGGAGDADAERGYQGRDIYQDIDGSWLIILRWDNKEAAEAWTPIFMTLKEGQAFGSLLDFSSARQEHYTLVNP